MADRRQIISTSYTAFTSSVSIKIKRCTIRSYKTTTKLMSCRSFVDLNALPAEYQSLGNSSGCLHHTLIDVGDDTLLHYIKYCIVLMIFISVLFLIRALTKFIVSCCEITSLHFWSFCGAKRETGASCLFIYRQVMVLPLPYCQVSNCLVLRPPPNCPNFPSLSIAFDIVTDSAKWFSKKLTL